jgi:hypothetical protein
MSEFRPLDALRTQINSATGAYEAVVKKDNSLAFPAAAITDVAQILTSAQAAAVIVVTPTANAASSADANSTAIQTALDAAGLLGTSNTEIVIHAAGELLLQPDCGAMVEHQGPHHSRHAPKAHHDRRA